jgi:hypothetical protein
MAFLGGTRITRGIEMSVCTVPKRLHDKYSTTRCEVEFEEQIQYFTRMRASEVAPYVPRTVAWTRSSSSHTPN